MTAERKGPVRLDIEMTLRGLAVSRSRARDLIERGFVTVEGRVERRPSAPVRREQRVELSGEAPRFVSRGAEKLIAGLDHFGFEVEGRVVLDVGASTGGFVEVLLQRGARKVYAIDVGHGQLAPDLARDPRVVNLEGLDARALTRDLVPEPAQAITADVSFISAGKALPTALRLVATGAWLVLLVKPQFELSPQEIGKGGIVREEAARQSAVQSVREFVAATPGWQVEGVIPSPILGGSGNTEYLLGARYHA